MIEVALNGRGEASHSDRGDDAGARSVIDQRQTGDVLAHGAKRVCRAWTRPVRAAVVGEIETGFRSGDDVVTVARIDPDFPDRVVLGKLSGRLR